MSLLSRSKAFDRKREDQLIPSTSFPLSLSLSTHSLTHTNQIAVDAAELDSFLAAAAAAHGDDWRVRLARAADWLGGAYSEAASRAPQELAASVAASGAALSLAQVGVRWGTVAVVSPLEKRVSGESGRGGKNRPREGR